MDKLLSSSVFQFSIIILLAAGVGVYVDAITFKVWLETAMTCLFTYAGKEGVVYASTAHRDKGNRDR